MTAEPRDEGGLDLAAIADFQLGGVTVSPSTGRVFQGRHEVQLQRRVMQVLVTFAQRAGETVTFQQLIDICWDGRIVGDDAVHRVLGRIRKLGQAFEPAPFTLQTVHRIGFRLIPNDLDPTPGTVSVSSKASSARAGRRLWIGAGLLIVVSGIAWFALRSPARPNRSGDVEVAAFKLTAADPESATVSSAIRDGVVRSLTGAGVGVVATDAATPDRRQAEFRVDAAIERTDGALMVKPAIRDRASGQVLWTDRFSATGASADGLAHDVSDAIAFNLHCALQDRAGAKVAVSLEVLQLYLNTCAGLRSTDVEPDRMLSQSRKLAAAAPKYASAQAMHGIAAAFAAFAADAPEAQDRLLAEARQAADLAIRLDPKAPKGYVAREMSRLPSQWAAREDDLTEALKIDPYLPPPEVRYVILLGDVGRFRKAVEISKQSMDTRDPRGVEADPRQPLFLSALGDLDGARAAMVRADLAVPHHIDDVRWRIETWLGDPAKAPPVASAVAAGLNPREPACAKVYLATENAGGKRTGLPAECAGLSPGITLRLLAREGDLDAAFAMLNARPARSRATLQTLYYPELAKARADPRFEGVAKRLGLFDYWRLPGRRPDFCGASSPPPVCTHL